MISSLPILKYRTFMLLSIIGSLAASCGSYQSASYYDNDGIYANGNEVSVERPTRTPQKNNTERSSTYSNYFGQQAELLDGEIFTDVDSYSSTVENDSIQESQLTDYYDNANDYSGYAAWGDNTTDVYVNFHDYNYGWAGWGWGSPWLWNNWGWGGGFYNGWGYGYRPFWGYRYSPWGWGGFGYAGYYPYGGFGWGWGGYATWCPPYGYYNGYNNYGYGRRDYVYNSSRRGYNTNAISGGASRVAYNTAGANNRNRVSSGYSSATRSGPAQEIGANCVTP